MFTFFSVFLYLLFLENLGAVRELSKVTGHLGHRVEDLERANETVTVCLHFFKCALGHAKQHQGKCPICPLPNGPSSTLFLVHPMNTYNLFTFLQVRLANLRRGSSTKSTVSTISSESHIQENNYGKSRNSRHTSSSSARNSAKTLFQNKCVQMVLLGK